VTDEFGTSAHDTASAPRETSAWTGAWMYDVWQRAAEIVAFLGGLSALLVLMAHLEATLDRPVGPQRPSIPRRWTAAAVVGVRTVLRLGRRQLVTTPADDTATPLQHTATQAE